MPRHIVQVRFNIPQGFRNINNNTDARYIFGRNQLYRIAFMRFTLVYARVFSENVRRIIEFILLTAALFSFLSLIYVHIVFVHLPITCLERHQKEWEGAKILRVELLRKSGESNYTLYDSYYEEHATRLLLAGLKPCPKVQYLQSDSNNSSEEPYPEDYSYKEESLDITDLLRCKLNESNEDKSFLDKVAEEINTVFSTPSPDEINIIEYSLEYGFLRLSPAMRKSLNLTVLYVTIDPDEDACVGGVFLKFILDYILGYDKLLISSVRHLAERNNYKGFVRNVGKEEEYIFMDDNGYFNSYLIAAIIMPVTTFSVSLLLRFSHQQMFFACTNLFDIIRFRGERRYNGSPLFTVVLALFGMMAIITSFFHNSALTLNVTFIIWLADFYDSICCRALMPKRHWYRFFLLYHYVFYAYNHRFNGLHWQLNLLTSWLFIWHSMVFFFHHYELPYYVQSFVQFRDNHALRRRSHPQVAGASAPNQPVEPQASQSEEQITDQLPNAGEPSSQVTADSGHLTEREIERLMDDNLQDQPLGLISPLAESTTNSSQAVVPEEQQQSYDLDNTYVNESLQDSNSKDVHQSSLDPLDIYASNCNNQNEGDSLPGNAGESSAELSLECPSPNELKEEYNEKKAPDSIEGLNKPYVSNTASNSDLTESHLGNEFCADSNFVQSSTHSRDASET